MLKLRVFTFGYITLRKHCSTSNNEMRPQYLSIVQIIPILPFKILAYNYGIICYPVAVYSSLLASAATVHLHFFPQHHLTLSSV